jgi:hypothetical protein
LYRKIFTRITKMIYKLFSKTVMFTLQELKQMDKFRKKCKLAERVGFEPTVPLPGQLLSRQPDSATLAPLRAAEYTMPRTGLEPVQAFTHKHLKLACLPIPPPRHHLPVTFNGGYSNLSFLIRNYQAVFRYLFYLVSLFSVSL